MAEFEYGPVELYSSDSKGTVPTDGTLDAIRELVEGGEIRLIDLLVISREDDGSVLITDYDEVSDAYGFEDIELAAVGLASEEDAQDFAPGIPAGHLRRAARHRAALGREPRVEVRRVRRHRPADRAHSRAGRQRGARRSRRGVGTCRSGEWVGPGWSGWRPARRSWPARPPR